jgi:hypothetical protein
MGLICCIAGMHCAAPPKRARPDIPLTDAKLAELWVEPRDADKRDLYHGIGGPNLAPAANVPYDFVSAKKQILSFSPGYTVRDGQGTEWLVKLGAEVRAEVLASRLIWAAGYHQPPIYYLESWQMVRDGKLEVQPPAHFQPKLTRYKRKDGWSWQQNPFVGTRAFQGLIVLMLMINNWDLEDYNNAIFDLVDEWDGARRWYIVRDVGASFSRNRGTWRQGTRGDLEGFAHEGFIDGVQDGHVIFAWNGRHQDLIQDITPADVRWIAQRLTLLTPTQWADALRAAGYKAQEAALIRSKLAERIAQALQL